jgi:hypothetical protein
LSVTAGFQDLFSRHAGTCSQFRPTFPKALYDYFARLSGKLVGQPEIPRPHGRSPLADIHRELEAAWDPPQEKRLLRCPLGWGWAWRINHTS